MDTQLTPSHPQTQAQEHGGKRRDAYPDVSIPGYIQPPDHSTVSTGTHDTIPHPDTESAHRDGEHVQIRTWRQHDGVSTKTRYL